MLYVPTLSDPPTRRTVVRVRSSVRPNGSPVARAGHLGRDLADASSGVERGRATTSADPDRGRLLEEAGGRGHLALEVARVEPSTPHRFVDAAQLRNGELAGQESQRLLGVLEVAAQPLQAVGEHRVV